MGGMDLAELGAFLQGAGLALTASALTFRPTRARAATTLTLGHGAAPGNPRTVAAETFAKMVAERTNGEVVVNIAGSEQLATGRSLHSDIRRSRQAYRAYALASPLVSAGTFVRVDRPSTRT